MTFATPTPEPGLLLRLAGPLQSWGERSAFNERDTAPYPTRSGVIGLLAAALGRGRSEPLDDLTRLSLTVRADRSGERMTDLHTVGGGLLPQQTVVTAAGGRRSQDTSTLLSHREYLMDAAFTAALTGRPGDESDAELLALCAQALRFPHWPPYLGRRACPPEGPLLLGAGPLEDVLHHLIRLPLSAPAPRNEQVLGGVEFIGDRPLDRLPVPDILTTPDGADSTHATSKINDEPLAFTPRRRKYRQRTVYRRALVLPANQYAGYGVDYLNELTSYFHPHLNAPRGSSS